MNNKPSTPLQWAYLRNYPSDYEAAEQVPDGATFLDLFEALEERRDVDEVEYLTGNDTVIR